MIADLLLWKKAVWEEQMYAVKMITKMHCLVCFIPTLPRPTTFPNHTLVLLQLIQDIFKRLSHAFLIFPQFNFGNGLMQLARMDIEVQLLSGYGIDAYKNPYSLDALGWMIISSLIQGLVFFTLRLLLNKRVTRKIRWGCLQFWVKCNKKNT